VNARLALLGLLLAAGPAPAAPQPAAAAAAPQPAGPTGQAIDAEVKAAIARYHLPGIAVGVIEDGRVVFARGYGEPVAGSGV
jgi:CubicO group peptidase (beta-lactamase class C family)